ncbi:MAG: DinB family protein [Ignavibacteriales bacterium]
MDSIQFIKEQFEHMEWADKKVWQAINKLPQPVTDDRIQKLLYHYHGTQYAFLSVWRKLPISVPDTNNFNLSSFSDWKDKNYCDLKSFLANLKPGDIDQVIELPWEKDIAKKYGKPLSPATLLETMMQVASHSSYHRGQVNARLREIGGEPPLVDFIAWIWMGKPKAG